MRRATALAMAGGALLLVAAALWIWVGTKESPELAPGAETGPRASGVGPEIGPRASGLGPPETKASQAGIPPSPDARGPKPEAHARQSAAALLATLRSSGPAHEPWEDQARTLLGALAQGDVDVTYAGCFVAGCAATIVFPTRAAYDRAASDPTAFPGWTGGRQWSDPDATEDGRATAVVVLYRPD